MAYRLAVAHAIERDGPIAQFHEVRDLVAPAERHVGEAMDQDDRAFGLSFGQSFEVVFVALKMSAFQNFEMEFHYEMNVGGRRKVFTYATYAHHLPQTDSAPSHHRAWSYRRRAGVPLFRLFKIASFLVDQVRMVSEL